MEENKKIESAEYVDSTANEEENSFSFKTLYTMFILNWQWFVLSVIVCLGCATLYLRYKSPTYQVAVKMLVKDDNNKMRSGGNTQMLSNMQDLGFISNSNGIDNEIEIIKSHILAQEAVKDLKLYVEYKQEGRFKDHLIYKSQPVNVDLDPQSLDKMDKDMLPITLTLKQEGRTIQVEGTAYALRKGMTKPEKAPFKTSVSLLPATIKTAAGTLTITRNYSPETTDFLKQKAMEVTILPPSAIAARYIGSMSVEPTSKATSIALITVLDLNRERAEDFLQQLVTCYNRQANTDKNEIAEKTEAFINGRLEKINAELGLTEGEMERYKKRNNLTQLKLDATQTLEQTSEYSGRLSEANSQIQLLDYLREYVNDPRNKFQIIPSNVGLKDVASTNLINTFNQAVLDRNRLLRSSSEIAPQVQTLTATLEELQKSVKEALTQARRSADIQRQAVQQQYNLYQNKVSSTPEQERILTQIGRQQEVKSGLYLMLLQKREENSISLAATADKGKLIDEPSFGGKVSPKGSVIMLIALVVGIGLPLGILFLIQLLRYKIEGHEDVQKLTKLPIVADVAVASENAKTAAGIVVQENKNNQIDEIFRSMRTNIQFMLKENQKVILFTSSTSGEGKTFNAANLAVSFALLGKKVILMGLDIRKPALGKLFSLPERNVGITALLSKDHISDADIKSQIQASGVNANLDVMMAGPIPPNPTELLARESLGHIVSRLHDMYDYIIMDTAPVGLVTDTLQIGKLADVTAYVCRADYTPKSSFMLVNELATEDKMPNMCIVLNGVDMSKKKYGYYYGYGKYGKYGKYGHYGRYGSYGKYGHYGTYGNYSNSHYGNANDNSIKK